MSMELTEVIILHTPLPQQTVYPFLGYSRRTARKSMARLQVYPCKKATISSYSFCAIHQLPVLAKFLCLFFPAASRSVRAHNRWLVAYTLLRNPSLQGLTGSRLAEERERERELHAGQEEMKA